MYIYIYRHMIEAFRNTYFLQSLRLPDEMICWFSPGPIYLDNCNDNKTWNYIYIYIHTHTHIHYQEYRPMILHPLILYLSLILDCTSCKLRLCKQSEDGFFQQTAHHGAFFDWLLAVPQKICAQLAAESSLLHSTWRPQNTLMLPWTKN